MAILKCSVATFEHGSTVPTWSGTFGAFLKANDTLSAEEVSDITVCLLEDREYEGGGGAEARWTLSRVLSDEEEPDYPEDALETPLDTPCLDDWFHRHEMDVD